METLSHKQTLRQTQEQKDGSLLFADLLSQPGALSADPQPDRPAVRRCWVKPLSGQSFTGGFITPSLGSPRQTGAHLGERRGVTEGWACSHSQSTSTLKNVYLFLPLRIMLAQSVQIIDLLARCRCRRLQDVAQELEELMPSP